MDTHVITFQDDYLNIFTRSYLWQTKHYNVFFDGGLASGAAGKLPYLRDGRKSVLLLTHGHFDHVMGVEGLMGSHRLRQRDQRARRPCIGG